MFGPFNFVSRNARDFLHSFVTNVQHVSASSCAEGHPLVLTRSAGQIWMYLVISVFVPPRSNFWLYCPCHLQWEVSSLQYLTSRCRVWRSWTGPCQVPRWFLVGLIIIFDFVQTPCQRPPTVENGLSFHSRVSNKQHWSCCCCVCSNTVSCLASRNIHLEFCSSDRWDHQTLLSEPHLLLLVRLWCLRGRQGTTLMTDVISSILWQLAAHQTHLRCLESPGHNVSTLEQLTNSDPVFLLAEQQVQRCSD